MAASAKRTADSWFQLLCPSNRAYANLVISRLKLEFNCYKPEFRLRHLGGPHDSLECVLGATLSGETVSGGIPFEYEQVRFYALGYYSALQETSDG